MTTTKSPLNYSNITTINRKWKMKQKKSLYEYTSRGRRKNKNCDENLSRKKDSGESIHSLTHSLCSWAIIMNSIKATQLKTNKKIAVKLRRIACSNCVYMLWTNNVYAQMISCLCEKRSRRLSMSSSSVTATTSL